MGRWESTRERITDTVVTEYFAKIDAFDVSGALDCFSDDAVLVCETRGVRAEGKEEIGAYLNRLIEQTALWSHEVTGWVIDEKTSKCAVELRVVNHRHDGTRLETENCDFFDFDGDGRITRIHYWTGPLTTPL